MGLPTSREQTYVTGVTKVPAVDMNAIQDGITEINQRIVWDHFTGSAIDSGRWNTATGVIVADDANGGAGAVSLTAQTLATLALAFGTSWRFRARLRNTGAAGTTVVRAGLEGTGGNTSFFINGGGSSTNWTVQINGVVTAPNGTAATISSTYKDFEMRLKSGTLTFLVNDVVLHSQAYATALSGDTVIIASGGAGTQFVDWVTFGPIP
jgi:hypothetical protein